MMRCFTFFLCALLTLTIGFPPQGNDTFPDTNIVLPSNVTPFLFFDEDSGDEGSDATIQLDGDEDSNPHFPYSPGFEKSYSQTIYTAEEMQATGAQTSGGTINKIRYLPSVSENIEYDKDWVIYMANTSMTVL